MDNAEQLMGNLKVLQDLALSDEDVSIIGRARTSPTYQAYEERKLREFGVIERFGRR